MYTHLRMYTAVSFPTLYCSITYIPIKNSVSLYFTQRLQLKYRLTGECYSKLKEVLP